MREAPQEDSVRPDGKLERARAFLQAFTPFLERQDVPSAAIERAREEFLEHMRAKAEARTQENPIVVIKRVLQEAAEGQGAVAQYLAEEGAKRLDDFVATFHTEIQREGDIARRQHEISGVPASTQEAVLRRALEKRERNIDDYVHTERRPDGLYPTVRISDSLFEKHVVGNDGALFVPREKILAYYTRVLQGLGALVEDEGLEALRGVPAFRPQGESGPIQVISTRHPENLVVHRLPTRSSGVDMSIRVEPSTQIIPVVKISMTPARLQQVLPKPR